MFSLLCSLWIFTVVIATRKDSPESGCCSQQRSDKVKDVEVLILGAGMAGISAAKFLSDHHISEFIILEGQDRIGGRVKNTILKSGVRVELGANWIQGIDPEAPDKHPLWSIAQKCGGVDGNYAPSFNNYTYHLFDERGRNMTNSSTAFKKRFAQWGKLINPGLDEYSQLCQYSDLPDISVRKALGLNGWTPTSPADDLIEWYGFDLDEYAVRPENISLFENFPDNTYFDFGDPQRTKNYFVTDQKEGFVKVVRCLAQDFLEGEEEDPRLHLNTTVTKIDWSRDRCVCASTVDNHGNEQEYCAPYAILTFSLGVLKSNRVEFVPELPDSKKLAINKGGFYLYLKIFLEFEEIFWKDDLDVDNFIRIDPIRGHYSQFQPLTKSIPVLFATVTDKIAEMVYKQSEAETTSQIMKILRGIYGEGIPDPISVTIPDWWVNPLFHGMYSSPPFGYKDKDFDILAVPLHGLYFGGEATNFKYAGYVHGAYYSGIDVAHSIVNKMASLRTNRTN